MKKSYLPLIILILICVIAVFVLFACDGDDGQTPILPVDDDSEFEVFVDKTALAETLVTYRGTMLGDSNVVKRMLREVLPGGDNMYMFDITLNRLTVQYDVTERSGMTAETFKEAWTLNNTQQILLYNTLSLFAVLEQLDSVQFQVLGFELPTLTVSRDAVKGILGFDPAYVEDADQWLRLIQGSCDDNITRGTFFANHPIVQK